MEDGRLVLVARPCEKVRRRTHKRGKVRRIDSRTLGSWHSSSRKQLNFWSLMKFPGENQGTMTRGMGKKKWVTRTHNVTKAPL